MFTSAAAAASSPRWQRFVHRPTAAAPRPAAAQSCPDDGGVCRSLLVPLDRDHPDGTQIRIRYELFHHTNHGRPPLPPIFMTEGGPGGSLLTIPSPTAPGWANSIRCAAGTTSS